MRFYGIFLSLVLFFIFLNITKCEYFSSISGLEELLNLEALYMESLASHIKEVEKYNKAIESFIDEVEEELKLRNETPEYFEYPINGVKTMKRFSIDWRQMEELIEKIQTINVYNESSSELPENFTLPNENDLNGAAQGVARLQTIYNLKSEDIAEGILKNKHYNITMTPSDCFVMGQSLYESEDFLYASEWLLEAWQMLEYDTKTKESLKLNNLKENQSADVYPLITDIQVLTHLGAALYNAGNRNLALLMNNKLLELDPENSYGLGTKELFQEGCRDERNLRILENVQDDAKSSTDYARTCNGDLQQSPELKRKLHCRYVTHNVPYFLLGPVKMEELNLEPIIAFYHQIITDNEIDQIIEAAIEYLQRSEVGSLDVAEVSDVRISKGSWIFDEQQEFLQNLYKRLEYITGLSIASSEPLQVANYGIGGHYNPHMDASAAMEIDFPDMGNRLLTALLYINDVELGGATVFPYLHLAVPPIKNGMVMWYNLHTSGEMDYRTTHAACPVIKGSKWISNKWFHVIGQELRRPCDLISDGHISLKYKESYNQ